MNEPTRRNLSRMNCFKYWNFDFYFPLCSVYNNKNKNWKQKQQQAIANGSCHNSFAIQFSTPAICSFNMYAHKMRLTLLHTHEFILWSDANWFKLQFSLEKSPHVFPLSCSPSKYCHKTNKQFECSWFFNPTSQHQNSKLSFSLAHSFHIQNDNDTEF